MKLAALTLIVVACVLTAWSIAAKPSYRAVIRMSIGDSVDDAGHAATMIRSRAIAAAALKHSSPLTVQPLANTRLVEITARDVDAARASTAATAVANAYSRLASSTDLQRSAEPIDALEKERALHDRMLTAARTALARNSTAAAGAETDRTLMASALKRQQAAHQRATEDRPAFLSVVAVRSPLDASVVGDDPLVQLLQMRATVMDGGRIRMLPVETDSGYPLTRGIDVVADAAHQEVALRARQLADAIRRDYEEARAVENAADEELDGLSVAIQAPARAAGAVAAAKASIAAEQSALDSITSREAAMRANEAAAPEDAARVIDARTLSDNRPAALARIAWFAAAVLMLLALLLEAIRDRTPSFRRPHRVARPLRSASRRILAAAQSR